MVADQLSVFLAGLVLGVTGMSSLGWMLFARRLKQERARLLMMEQARQLAAQQAGQARKQVEQLQRECHELKLALRPPGVHSTQPVQLPPQAPAPLPASAAETARLQALAQRHGGAGTADDQDEATGFPDTQILRQGSRR